MVVSIYGIFVIETKTYQGIIIGGENSEHWTQNIYGNKYEFRNPILQNHGHIKSLKQVLVNYKSAFPLFQYRLSQDNPNCEYPRTSPQSIGLKSSMSLESMRIRQSKNGCQKNNSSVDSLKY